MQTNICNAFCMLLGTWRCNDAFVIVFRLGDVDAHSTCWVYPLLDLQFLQKKFWSQFQHNDCTKSTLNLSKFINHSWDSVHSINLINFDFYDHHLFAIRKVRGIVNHPILRAYYLPSEELTSTPKFRENLIDKTCEHWV